MTSAKILLSSNELKRIGSELEAIVNNLEMANFALGQLSTLQTLSDIHADNARKYQSLAYRQNEIIIEQLDNIAFMLLNNDDARELGADA